MLTLTNKFKEFIKLVENLDKASEMRESMHTPATNIGWNMLTLLKEEAPDGEKWTDPSDFPSDREPRPSIRLHNTTLAAAWGIPDTEFLSDGARTTIFSAAPHMELLFRGSSGAKYGGDPWLSFHWFKGGFNILMDAREGQEVDHPGFEASQFAEKARVRGRFYGIDQLGLGIRDFLTPLRSFFRRD